MIGNIDGALSWCRMFGSKVSAPLPRTFLHPNKITQEHNITWDIKMTIDTTSGPVSYKVIGITDETLLLERPERTEL